MAKTKGECGVTMRSVAVLEHVHRCSRPAGHVDDPKDPDHFCKGCSRHFWERPDKRRRV